MPSQIINKALQNEFSVHTQYGHWVIPHNCELLKALLRSQKLNADDINFESPSECKHFIKHLFLLALEDETKNHEPSSLASFARELMRIQKSNINRAQHTL